MTRMSEKLFFLLAVAVCLLSMDTKAMDVNCLQMPATHMRFTCCRYPRYNFHIYDRQCAHVASKSGIFGLGRYFHPCAQACVFNATALLDQQLDLNLPRLHVELPKVIGDQRFARLYYASFEKCVPVVRAKIAKATAKGKTAILTGRKCSNIPIMYGICAHMETFVNCPADAWTDSKQCDETRRFIKDCIYKV